MRTLRRGFSLKAISIAGCRSWRGLGLQPHMARWSLLVACLSLAAAAALQLPSASAPGTLSRTVWTTPSTQLRARVVAAGAAPQIAKPKTIIKPKTGGAKPATPDQKLATAQPKLQRKSEDCPMWKVLLLGDEEYEVQCAHTRYGSHPLRIACRPSAADASRRGAPLPVHASSLCLLSTRRAPLYACSSMPVPRPALFSCSLTPHPAGLSVRVGGPRVRGFARGHPGD